MAKAPNKSPVKDGFYSMLSELWSDLKEDVIHEAGDRIKKAIYEAKNRFHGKTIAIIGPPAAGKTTLLKVLSDQNTPADRLRTYYKTELETHDEIIVDFKLSISPGEQVPFKFKVRKNSDVGGEEYVREEHWPKVIKGASVVIYLLEGPRLLSDTSGEYRNRILSDFDWLLDQSQLLQPNFAIVLGFNKVDELCDRKSYKSFAREQNHHMNSLRTAIAERWPDDLVPQIKGSMFLSLLEPGLRVFTLNGLVSCFVGDELMKLYQKTK